MGLLVALVAVVPCAIIYVRMYRREAPEPIGKRKALLPVVLGLIAPFFSTLLVGLIGFFILQIAGGRTLPELIPSRVLSSLAGSFLLAGFTEELIKFLLFLLTVKLVKPKNVYEYGLLCAGIGFGFTVLEDALYGGGNVTVALARLLFFAMHMAFGLIMGTYYGLSKYDRRKGRDSAGRHLFLALFLPVLWHTLYDAATTANAGITSEDETMQMVGVVIAIIAIIVSVVLQFVVLVRFKKKSEEYCAMDFSCES